ncbi:MAG: metalloregulator ArsR/SmtB family transcription factor [Candidatus Caldatribacteriota bacterium]
MSLSKEKILKIFKALSDEVRLNIFLYLLQGELCVCELTELLKMEQSRISHQLKILKEAKLVNSERRGKWIIYSINPEIMDNILIQNIKNQLKLSQEEQQALSRIKTLGLRNNCKIIQKH